MVILEFELMRRMVVGNRKGSRMRGRWIGRGMEEEAYPTKDSKGSHAAFGSFLLWAGCDCLDIR